MIVPCNSCKSTFQLDSRLVKSTGNKVRCSKCQEVFRVYPPPAVNRRKHSRVKTQNLISYFAYNEKDKLISHGMGVALDISKSGILLETPYLIEAGLLVLTATDSKRQFIEVKGNFKYAKASSSGTYLYGIEFADSEERVIIFITNMIKVYNIQKNNLFITFKKKIYRENILSNPHIHTTHTGVRDQPNRPPADNIIPTNDLEKTVKDGAAEYADLPDLSEIEEIVDSILDEKDHLSHISPHIQAKYSLTQGI